MDSYSAVQLQLHKRDTSHMIPRVFKAWRDTFSHSLQNTQYFCICQLHAYATYHMAGKFDRNLV